MPCPGRGSCLVLLQVLWARRFSYTRSGRGYRLGACAMLHFQPQLRDRVERRQHYQPSGGRARYYRGPHHQQHGTAVGYSSGYAVEWSGGSVINLGPGQAYGINNIGQVVGVSYGVGAVEWSDGKVIALPGPSGGAPPLSINDLGRLGGDGSSASAVEWSDGKAITLGGFARLRK